MRCVIAIVPLFMVGVLANCAGDSGDSIESQVALKLQAEYGNCPDLDTVCEALEGPGAIRTGYCLYEQCFEINHAARMMMTAAKDEGDFPTKLFFWGNGGTWEQMGIACRLSDMPGGTIVSLPEKKYDFCMAGVTFPDGKTYYEHWASEPKTGCFGWVECTHPSR